MKKDHDNLLQVTKNFVGSPHTDMLDTTVQYTVSLGEFAEGGQLCVDATEVNTKSPLLLLLCPSARPSPMLLSPSFWRVHPVFRKRGWERSGWSRWWTRTTGWRASMEGSSTGCAPAIIASHDCRHLCDLLPPSVPAPLIARADCLSLSLSLCIGAMAAQP